MFIHIQILSDETFRSVSHFTNKKHMESSMENLGTDHFILLGVKRSG